MMKTIKLWNRGSVQSQCLEVLMTRLNKAWNNQIWPRGWPYFEQEALLLKERPPEVQPELSYVFLRRIATLSIIFSLSGIIALRSFSRAATCSISPYVIGVPLNSLFQILCLYCCFCFLCVFKNKYREIQSNFCDFWAHFEFLSSHPTLEFPPSKMSPTKTIIILSTASYELALKIMKYNQR